VYIFPAMMSPEKTTSTPHAEPRLNRTGEDIDMLNEGKSDPESGDAASSRYQDDIDGA
jgi:hypothetical protein